MRDTRASSRTRYSCNQTPTLSNTLEKNKNTLNGEDMYNNIDQKMSRVPESMRLFMSEELPLPLSERRSETEKGKTTLNLYLISSYWPLRIGPPNISCWSNGGGIFDVDRSAQSHSRVIGICQRSCGTKGCWKEKFDASADVV
jgi:hypothetical protein